MKTKVLKLALAVAVVVLTAALAHAQQARSGLTGVVLDPGGLALPGVTVTATNVDTGIARTSVTTATGRYIFNSMASANYTLRFELASFKTLNREGVVLSVGQQLTIDVTLDLGGVEETVTVTGETPMLELKSKEVGGVIGEDAFEQLPTQNRSFVMFAAYMPGVVPNPQTGSTASDSIFVNGQDDNNNAFYVDGAENSDDVIGARAGAQTRTAIEAIQEFQVLTSQFDAEFGRTQGAVLNAITKSGTNDPHGVGFYYTQDSAINGKDIFTKRAGIDNPERHVNVIGGVIGGPIIKDKAHFFVSYERITPNEGVTNTFETRPDLNYSTSEDTLLRNWILKADLQVAQNHQFSIRWLQEYSPQFNQVIGNGNTQPSQAALREEDDTDTNWITSFESLVGTQGFNNFRFSSTREDVSFANPGFNNNGQTFDAQRAQTVSQLRQSVLDGASEVAQSRINQSYQIDDTFTLFVPDMNGDHNMKFGANFSRRSEEFNNFGTANGQFNFDTDAPWQPNALDTQPEFFELRVGGPSGSDFDAIPDNNVFGAFYQDDWTINNRLTLNLGLRWDWEEVTKDNNNVSPRIGFAYDLTGEGRTVLRGGYGRFYERMQLGDAVSWSGFFQDAVLLNGGVFTRFPNSGSDKDFFLNATQANGFTDLEQLKNFMIGTLEGAGAARRVNTQPTVDNPDRVAPYSDTLSIGVQHEVAPDMMFGVDYINNKNNDVRVEVDLNPFSAAQGGRPNLSILNGAVVPGMGAITSTVNAGESRYQALQFSLRRRFTESPVGRLGINFAYTYASQSGNYRANGNSGGNNAESLRFHERTESGYNFDTGEFIGEPLRLNLDDPRNLDRPSPWHRDHNFVTGWAYLIPNTGIGGTQGLHFSGNFRYMTGQHYTLQELARGDNNQRLLAPAGTYSANIDSDIALDSIETSGKQNGAVLPDFVRLDFTFRYGFTIREDMTLTVLVDIFNVTDRVNWNNAGSTFTDSTAFLIPGSVLAPREYQFGLRFQF